MVSEALIRPVQTLTARPARPLTSELAANRCQVTIHHLSTLGDTFRLTEVAGKVNGDDTKLYLWEQVSWAGDGMSTSPETRTDAASRRKTPNYYHELRRFHELQKEFAALSPAEKRVIKNGWKKDEYSERVEKFRPVFESENHRQIFETTKTQDKYYDGVYTYSVSRK